MLTFNIEYEVAGKLKTEQVRDRTATGAIRQIQSRMRRIMRSVFRLVKISIAKA